MATLSTGSVGYLCPVLTEAGNTEVVNCLLGNETYPSYMPSTDDVAEGGRPVHEAEGVEFLRSSEGETVLAVGSGRYEFEGRMARG